MDNTPPEAGESGQACPDEQAILRGRPGIFQRNLQRQDQTDLLRGSAGRGLAENYLRPAGQPGGHRAKIIAAGQRNTRQLSGQRL